MNPVTAHDIGTVLLLSMGVLGLASILSPLAHWVLRDSTDTTKRSTR